MDLANQKGASWIDFVFSEVDLIKIFSVGHFPASCSDPIRTSFVNLFFLLKFQPAFVSCNIHGGWTPKLYIERWLKEKKMLRTKLLNHLLEIKAVFRKNRRVLNCMDLSVCLFIQISKFKHSTYQIWLKIYQFELKSIWSTG